MTREVRLRAHAKINWSLEVLHVRPDGFHEVRSVLQTIDLHDGLSITAARSLEIRVSGDASALADLPAENNLAFRSAAALRNAARVTRGACIAIEKHIPIAAGLGGGSADAAAALRGCAALWGIEDLGLLLRVAARVGSDVPALVCGGTVAVSGRGELVEPLRDAQPQQFLLAVPRAQHRGEKTAAMYGAITRDSYSDGDATIGVREIVQEGRTVEDAHMANAFERVVGRIEPETERAMEAIVALGYNPHLAGSGPSFFVMLDGAGDWSPLSHRVRDLGFDVRVAHTVARSDALTMDAR